MNRTYRLLSLSVLVSLGLAGAADAQQVACRAPATRVRAVGLPGNHNITTRFQLDTPNLQTLMSATVNVTGKGSSCLIAGLSALTRITDNYVVYQVRVDGVPMEGQVGGWAGVPDPVVPVLFDDEDEQFVDPFRILSYSFFRSVAPGPHLVEVMVAAGSNIAPGLEPQVVSPVLTLHYR
jgi:hypothetical protein